MTLSFALDKAEPQSPTPVCFLKACQQAGVTGCFAGLSSNVAYLSLVRCGNRSFSVKQLPLDMCASGLPFNNYTGRRQRPYT